jgi:hypothetical protein
MVSQNRQSLRTGRSASVSPGFCLQYSKVRDLPHASNYIEFSTHVDGDSDQVVVTTLANLFNVKKALSKGNLSQLIGAMTEETLSAFDR